MPSPVDESTQAGEVVVSLSSDFHNVTLKSVEEEVDLDNFWIEIFNSRKIRLYSQQYSSAKDAVIKLNTGEYRLLAKLGDSLGVGFDKPFYMADEPFTVHGQTKETVNAVARLANVKAAVTYGENIANFYPEGYYAVIRHDTIKGKSLKFLQTETRAGYIPAGKLVLEVYAKIDGSWRYFAAPAEEYSPNDFVTFKVDVDPDIKGSLMLNIKVDNSVETIEKNVEISPDALSAEAPYIVAAEFDGNDSYYIYEGAESVSADNVSFSYSAKAGIQSCVLEIESEYLAGLGVPASVDFASLSDASVLEKAGFFWASSTTVGVIDLSGILSGIARNSVYESKDTPAAKFTLTVTDSRGKEAQQTAYIKLYPDAKASVDIADYNVWARKIVEPGVSVQKGNMDKFTLEYSVDGASWNAVDRASASASNLGFATVTGLNADTEYKFRAVYDGWFIASDVFMARTEAAAQVGNAGFEEWTTESFAYKVTAQSGRSVDWYLPWTNGGTDQWWAVNSKKTMRDECSGTALGIGSNFNYKNFPAVSYYDGNSRAAQLATVCTGKSATSTSPGSISVKTAAGEIWIGTATDGGDHETNGHAFASRPAKLSFWYQYLPYSGESFNMYVELKDAEGNVIASGEITDGQEESAGKVIDIPLAYSATDRKAASIYMCFKSSTASSPSWQRANIVMPGGNEAALVGSILRIDDIELIYE
ncbi:MAG: DUF4493 domain-containing protein [Clostridium sp.]|nr:DUF4493 domain-containing protein [Bacteroides sp.]MCM1198426.1 DUF4493 domain-containing protein [Clostridium sp.]